MLSISFVVYRRYFAVFSSLVSVSYSRGSYTYFKLFVGNGEYFISHPTKCNWGLFFHLFVNNCTMSGESKPDVS